MLAEHRFLVQSAAVLAERKGGSVAKVPMTIYVDDTVRSLIRKQSSVLGVPQGRIVELSVANSQSQLERVHKHVCGESRLRRGRPLDSGREPLDAPMARFVLQLPADLARIATAPSLPERPATKPLPIDESGRDLRYSFDAEPPRLRGTGI